MTNLDALNPEQLATLYVLLNKAGADTETIKKVQAAGDRNCGQDFIDEICAAWEREAKA